MPILNRLRWPLRSSRTAGSGTVITRGLVGYWKFDEPSGSSCLDSSGRGNTGIYNGTTINANRPPRVAFPDPYCRTFRGTGDFINLGTTPPIRSLTFPYTLSCWVKASNLTQQGLIIDFTNMNVASNNLAVGFFGGSNYVIVSAATLPVYPTSNFTSGVWQNWVIAYTSQLAGGNSFYLNGSLLTPSGTTDGWGATSKMYLGAQGGSPSQRTFNGSLDDIRIYNRILTTVEISQIAAGVG